jgi:DNA-binding NarL/FixJ family response regulator
LACDELASLHLPNAAAGFVEIGEIRLRLGDLDGAEAAFARASELGGAPPAGLALLRLAQNRMDAAASIIGQALEGETWNRLARARLLVVAAQIAIAASSLASASSFVGELEAVAADYDSPMLLASAATARGRLFLASGDAPAACATLRLALGRWQELSVPHEVATVHTLLGLACRDRGDDEAAVASFAAATSVFDQLGAALDLRLVRDLTSSSGRALPGGLTEREAQVLRLVAAGHTNRDVAGSLYLAEKTVARHLSNIFTKIGVSSRAAATAFAFEQGIVERG